MSSLGSRHCERSLNGRAGQAASRLPAPVRARAAARVRHRTRAAAHAPPRRPPRARSRSARLLRPSSELSAAGSRGADRLVGRKVERDRRGARAETAGAGTVSGDRAPSRPATARQDDEARRPLRRGRWRAKRGASGRKLQRDSYELCSATKPLRIESFHDQFGYTPETKNLGPVLLRLFRA